MRAAALAAAAALLAPEVAAQNCQPWQHTQKFDLVVSALSDFANTAMLIDQNLNEIAAGVGATFAAGAYAGGSGGSVGASFDVAVSDEYQAAIMDADTDGDGTLSAAELAADPQAAAMVEAIQQSICDQLPSCSDPSTVEVQGVSAGRRRMQEGVVQTLQVRMDGAYAATLGDTNGDGLLSAAEIAADGAAPKLAALLPK